MGTKVQYKTLPGHYPVGDLNDDPNSGTWPVYYGDKTMSCEQFNDSHTPKTVADAYFGYHTETVKQKMLEHEAIFKSQLQDLHRLYRVQRDLMDEMKMNELHKQSMALETSMSSCSASQRQDTQLWHTLSAFPMSSSSCAKQSVLGGKDFNTTPSFPSGKSQQNGLVSPSNIGSSIDCEVEILECRPSKARKKVFDLELRADEYIDVEEPRIQLKKPSSQSCYASNRICDEPHSSSSKLFLGGTLKTGSRVEGARNGLADLNEQIQIQESNSSSVNVDGHNSNIRPSIGPARFISEPQLHTIPRQFMHSSQHGRDDGSSRYLNTGLKEKGREWLHMFDSAQSKMQTTNFSSKLPEQSNLFNASYRRTDLSKGVYWNGRSEIVSDHPGRGLDFFNRLGNTHQLDRPISHSMAPWEKSGSCVTQNSITADMHPFYNSTITLPPSLQSSSRRLESTGEAWQTKSGFGRDIAYQNGMYNGSCSGSGSAQLPNKVSDYQRCGNGHVASDHRLCQNGSKKLNGLNCIDARGTKGIDLNALSVIDSDEAVPMLLQGATDDHVAGLPWLKFSTGLRNGIISNNSLTGQTNGSGSTVCIVETKLATKKSMEVPNFGESQLSKDGSSCRSTLSKAEEVCNIRLRGFDMNLPCESEENATENLVVSKKKHIDLNRGISEDEMVTALTPGTAPKTYRGFDLEAPGETEEEEFSPLTHRSEKLEKDLEAAAAKAIVGISHCKELNLLESPARKSSDPKPHTLQWFVEAIASCGDDANQVLQDTTGNNVEDSDASDYFEYMTLQLPETKEEGYLTDYPKPPEPDELTGAGAAFATRTRKGQAKRGRPRRDFQRDILPGLTSLARHEVTEDLQTFGGLMRAMGHSWQSGLTRRAGPRRGRPRLTPLQPPNPHPPTNLTPVCSPLPPKRPISETFPSSVCTPSPQKRTTSELIIMEDHRSLTGWGKTTRRPRRQRCPPGNVSVLHIA